MRSWLVFEGPIRQASHKLKYRRNIALGEALAQQLVAYVGVLGWPVDVVVPVPLGKARMKERGYNQVGMVAMPLASMLNWQYEPKTLVRVRKTRTQVGLSVAERKQNVSGAFHDDPVRMAGKTVLVMDDVATTGATLLACADACMESGAKAVYALTIARALPQHGLNIV
jgi:competence protein ComFC